jgi:hypothetical protein
MYSSCLLISPSLFCSTTMCSMSVAVTVSTVHLTTLALDTTDKPFQLHSHHTNKEPTCYSTSRYNYTLTTQTKSPHAIQQAIQFQLSTVLTCGLLEEVLWKNKQSNIEHKIIMKWKVFVSKHVLEHHDRGHLTNSMMDFIDNLCWTRSPSSSILSLTRHLP